jgi:hypothetical protein
VRGATITPVADDNGNIIDFSVDNGYNGYSSSDQDYVETNDGQTHHVFENVSIEEDGEYSSNNYLETLANSDPRIPQAIAWASQNLPQEDIIAFNQALDEDNHDHIHQVLEYLLSNLPEDYQVEEVVEEVNETDPEEFVDGLTDEDVEAIEEVISELYANPALGDDAAQEWVSVAEEAEAVGDETYAAIAKAAALYHSGSLDAETAINSILDRHNLQDVIRVVQHLGI